MRRFPPLPPIWKDLSNDSFLTVVVANNVTNVRRKSSNRFEYLSNWSSIDSRVGKVSGQKFRIKLLSDIFIYGWDIYLYIKYIYLILRIALYYIICTHITIYIYIILYYSWSSFHTWPLLIFDYCVSNDKTIILEVIFPRVASTVKFRPIAAATSPIRRSKI